MPDVTSLAGQPNNLHSKGLMSRDELYNARQGMFASSPCVCVCVCVSQAQSGTKGTQPRCKLSGVRVLVRVRLLGRDDPCSKRCDEVFYVFISFYSRVRRERMFVMMHWNTSVCLYIFGTRGEMKVFMCSK